MAQMGLLAASPARPLPALRSKMTMHVAEGSAREKENWALVAATLSALNARDEAGFVSRIDEGAVLDDLTQPAAVVGKRGVKAWFESWAAAVPDARSDVATLLGVGEFVLAESVVHGTLTSPLGGLSPSDRAFAVHRAVIFEVAGGALTSLSIFMNRKELAEAVGQWPPPEMK